MTFYIKINNDYVFDVVDFDPKIEGYEAYEINQLPENILCGCYKLIDNNFILDQQKHQLFLDEVNNYILEGDTDV